MKRTFVAVKIPISEQIAELIEGIKFDLADEKIKWVSLGNLHITLYFLGATEQGLIEKIGESLDNQLKEFKSFSVQCKGVGVFKNLYNPKVLWLGIEASPELKELKKKVEKALQAFGFQKEEREFQPHLTLGRIKHIKNKASLSNILNEHKNTEIQKSIIDKVIFYESELTPKGAIYKEIREIKLD